MNLPTLVVLLVIAALALLAVRIIRRKKLLHNCGGDCSHCPMGCQAHPPEGEKKPR